MLTPSWQCEEDREARTEKQEWDWSQWDAEQTGFVLKALQLIDRMRACLAGCHVTEGEQETGEGGKTGLLKHRRCVSAYLSHCPLARLSIYCTVCALYICQLTFLTLIVRDGRRWLELGCWERLFSLIWIISTVTTITNNVKPLRGLHPWFPTLFKG